MVNFVYMNTKSFYDSIRPSLFKGKISAKQFQGIEAIIAEYNRFCLNDPRKLAYVLATAYHESAMSMQPIPEYGKGAKYDYGKKLKMSRKTYTTPDKLYYGRGLVQLTWYENYQAMGKFLSMPLLEDPDLLLDMEVSVRVLFTGMIRGMFTGKSLSTYFTADKTDWVNARRIINGTDVADRIANYAKIFYNAILLT